MDRYNPRLGSTSPLPWLLLGAVLLAWATFDGTAASSQFLLAVSNFEYFCMGALGLYLAARGIIPSSREWPPAWALSGLAAGIGGVFVRGLGWYATTAGGFRLMPACYYASLVSTFLDLVFAVELAVELKRACVGGVSNIADTAATRTAAKSDILAFLSAAVVICLPSGLPARGLQLLAATLRLQQATDPATAQDDSLALGRAKEGWLGLVTGSAACRI